MITHVAKKITLTALAFLFYLIPISGAMAQDGEPSPTAQATSGGEDGGADPGPSLKTILLHLGQWLGYDITNPPSTYTNTLLEKAGAILNLKSQTESPLLLLGTIPGNTVVPSNDATFAGLNSSINAIFKQQASGGQGQAGGLTTLGMVDQKLDESNTGSNPLIDPIQQTIVNNLITHSFSTCDTALSATNTEPLSAAEQQNCIKRNQEAIATHVLGSVPNPNKLHKLDTATVNQMNSNSLTAPLLYSTSQTSQQPTSKTEGLVATSQVQDAENFIRYVSFEFAPTPTITQENFVGLYNEATDTKNTPAYQAEKMAALSNYFVTRRSLAAQQSVAIANLYSILSKRMPQTTNSADKTAAPTSEALNEYVMATRRLYDPKLGNNQWIDQINTASTATVEKEIARVLAEIHYQLYLNGQQQERLLLTNSILTLQIAHALEMNTQPPRKTGAGESETQK